MLRYFYVALACFFTSSLYSQPCTGPGQNPITAIPVCGTTIFVQDSVSICTGQVVPTPPCNNLTIYTDRNPFWYKFHCFQSGTLGFLVVPKVITEDYDWQLFDVTNHNPMDVYTNSSLFVQCNWSGVPGTTGAVANAWAINVCSSSTTDSIISPNKSIMPNLVAGHDYLLMVSHFTNTQYGYDLTFSGGNAVITDTITPYLKYARAICDGTNMLIVTNKRMRCNTLDVNGSDFVLQPNTAPIIGASSNCYGGFDFDTIRLTLANPLPAGKYNIVVKNGTDNNTLQDICYNSIAPGSAIPVEVFPSGPTPMDSLTTIQTCNPDSAVLVFRRPIQCNTIASDGSDFIVTGPDSLQIASAYGVCNSDSTTWQIIIKFKQPIYVSGTYTITLKQGNDGNTLIDECNFVCVAGQQINFNVIGRIMPPIVAPNALCIYDTAVASNPIVGGSWTVAKNLLKINSAGKLVPLQAGADTIQYFYVDSIGCILKRKKVIQIFAKPTLSGIQGNSAVCVNKSFTYNCFPSGGVWKVSDLNLAQVNTFGQVQTKQAGKVVLVYTYGDSTGCYADTSTVITIWPHQKMNPIIGDSLVCGRSLAAYTVFPKSGVWQSSDTSVFTIDNNGSVYTKDSGSAQILHIKTNAGGCMDTIAKTISIIPLLKLDTIAGPAHLCLQDTGVYTNNTAGGNWMLIKQGNATALPSGVLYAQTAGNYILEYKVNNSNGCVSTVAKNITITSKPSLTGIRGIRNLCEGRTDMLSVIPYGGIWKADSLQIATIQPTSGVITALQAGVVNISYTYTDSVGCTSEVKTLVTIHPKPVVGNIIGKQTVCVGSVVTYSNNVANGFWVVDLPNVASIGVTGVLTAKQVGKVQVGYVVKNNYGCFDTAKLNVTIINSTSLPAIQGKTSLCVNDSSMLIGPTNTGYWQVQNSSVISVQSNGTILAITPGRSYVYFYDSTVSTCLYKDSVLVTVNDKPQVDNINIPTSICVQDTFNANNVVRSGTWLTTTPQILSIHPTTGICIALQAGVGQIQYVLASPTGCATTAAASVVIKPVPQVSMLLPQSICLPNTTAIFTNATIVNNSAKVKLYWNFGDGYTDSFNYNKSFTSHTYATPILANGYTISLKVVANGCTSDTTALLMNSTFKQKPNTDFRLLPSAQICVGQTLQLEDATTSKHHPIKQSIWYLGDNSIDSGVVVSHVYPRAGQYWLSHVIQDKEGCYSDTMYKLIKIDSFPTIQLPTVIYVLQGDSVMLEPKLFRNDVQVAWQPAIYFNQSNIINPICTPQATTNYTVQATTDSALCLSTAYTQVVVLPKQLQIPNAFSPNNDGIHDSWVIPQLQNYPNAVVEVFTRSGQRIFSSSPYTKPWDGKYNNQLVPVGTYYYIITIRNKKYAGAVTIFW